MNAFKVWLCAVLPLATALLLCNCTATSVRDAWMSYDPLQPLPPQQAENFEKEATRLEAKLHGRPDDRASLARLADLRFLQNRDAEAVALYRRSLAGSTRLEHLEQRARYGTALLHVEENTEARAVLEGVLKEDPENPRALLSYAEYQATIIGDNAYAMALLQRAKRTGRVFIPPDFEQSLEQNLN